MTDLDDDAKALFQRARVDLTPTDEDRRRVERAVMLGLATGAAGASAIGASGAAGAASAVGGAGAVASAASAGAVKVLVAFAISAGLGAGGVAAYRGLGAAESAKPAVALVAPPEVGQASANAVPTPSGDAPEAIAEVPVQPEKEAEPVRPKGAGVRARASAEVPAELPSAAARPLSAAAVAEEAKLLREADRALRAGNSERALALLDAHELAHPEGALGQERAAERVFALCAAGRTADARKAAAAFLARFPQSPLSKRVQETCRADAEPGASERR